MISRAAEEKGRRFATEGDYEVCRRLHRQHGSTYYFAARRFPATVRRRVHAVYGFVRVPDEWVDNPGSMDIPERRRQLDCYRRELILGFDGVVPECDVLRAFCDVCRESQIPIDEPLHFLEAMEMDLQRTRYETYADLRDYMRGSASAVGLMMCRVLEMEVNEPTFQAAAALGEAMQLTNFLRDVAEDFGRGRIYLPQEDLQSFQVRERDILRGIVTEEWRRLMRFEIERARALYRVADQGLPRIPRHARKAVMLARVLYARILNRIEEQGYDVFSKRARTSSIEKLTCAARVVLGLQIAV
jgi:phytoene synthase